MPSIIVGKWFYVYIVPACIHSDKGWSFENEILEQLYTLYRVKQSTTMSYILHEISTCERFNCMLHDLLRTFDKEQKPNWPLNLPWFNIWSQSINCVWHMAWIWQNIMTSICKARVHGWINSKSSTFLCIGGHWKTSSKQPKKQQSVWEETFLIYLRIT